VNPVAGRAGGVREWRVISSLDARIQRSVVATLSARPAALDAGPFVLGLDPGTDNPSVNYATPRPDAAITADDVTALVAAFRRADRVPRLEYVTACAPALEGLLIGAGFAVEARHDYLICTPETVVVPATPDGFALCAPASDEQRAALVIAQNDAFGAGAVAAHNDVLRVERLQADGGIAVIAVTGGGTCAGGGQASVPRDGVSEVAAIAVREPFRRRGLAGAVTAAITRRLFDAGADLAWLEASGEDAWRVYGRVGYRPAGKRLYIALD
jgi:ribosomal protein S18 acetylase RimI-like enzyme